MYHTTNYSHFEYLTIGAHILVVGAEFSSSRISTRPPSDAIICVTYHLQINRFHQWPIHIDWLHHNTALTKFSKLIDEVLKLLSKKILWKKQINSCDKANSRVTFYRPKLSLLATHPNLHNQSLKFEHIYSSKGSIFSMHHNTYRRVTSCRSYMPITIIYVCICQSALLWVPNLITLFCYFPSRIFGTMVLFYQHM